MPNFNFYNGIRSAKELKNFVWDMEQYFLVTRIPNTKKGVYSIYLFRGIKLWWRTQMREDDIVRRLKIDT